MEQTSRSERKLTPVIPLRLQPDQDLKIQIEKECQKINLSSAFVVSGIGSLKTLRLRLANSSQILEVDEKFEILTLQGSISKNGLHLHMSVANSKGHVLGGHLMPGCLIFTTAEILISEIPNYELMRTQDPTTGFLELEVRKL